MWLVSVPVWGARYLQVFEQVTVPALRKAISYVKGPVKLMVHTHEPERVKAILAGLEFQTFPVPTLDNSFMSLSESHRQVLAWANPGDFVALLTADLVVSVNALATCEAYFALGRRLICCMGMRVDEAYPPEPGLVGRLLLDWGWRYAHPMTRECTWPEGHSYDVWRMYFERDGQVACRLMLPHPLAVYRDRRNLPFYPTVDVNLMANFRQEEIQVITEPDEAALIELSPANKEFVLTETMRHRFIHGGPSSPSFTRIGHRLHRWMFTHRIVIRGTGEGCGDDEVTGRLLS